MVIRQICILIVVAVTHKATLVHVLKLHKTVRHKGMNYRVRSVDYKVNV